mmetsp:Transcript_35611/g.112321  ORF Transcript_35611/g.112321 Transcript_35611/m.112321 type:complete len:212 (-) Transcript_35611:565-1200(-)
MVGAELVSQRLASSGRSRVRDMTTRTGMCPPSRRVVSRGLSRRTVLPPTITASERERTSNTCCRAAGQLTHAECPWAVAILPSMVMAYLSTEKGRVVTVRWRSGSFTRRHASTASSSAAARSDSGPDALPLNPSTWTSTPAPARTSMARPWRCFRGCFRPTTTRVTPASMSELTAESSPWQSPLSRLRYAVPPRAPAPAAATAWTSALVVP